MEEGGDVLQRYQGGWSSSMTHHRLDAEDFPTHERPHLCLENSSWLVRRMISLLFWIVWALAFYARAWSII